MKYKNLRLFVVISVVIGLIILFELFYFILNDATIHIIKYIPNGYFGFIISFIIFSFPFICIILLYMIILPVLYLREKRKEII